MSILNVNTIQPVGSGQTITVSATNISAPSTVVTASSFVGNVTGNLSGGVLSGISTIGVTTVYASGSLQSNSIVPVGGIPAGASGGGIIQCVSATTSTQVIVNNQTYTDTGLSASITPRSTNSKILVLVNQVSAFTVASGGMGGGLRLLRDATTILTPVTDGTGPYESYASGTGLWSRYTINYLDSPATTSSVTYKTQGRNYSSGQTATFQISATTNGTSTILLLEISG